MAEKEDIEEGVAEMEADLARSIEANQHLQKELSFLFGTEIVELASQIDVSDLNLNKEMTDSIAAGVKLLKQQKNRPDEQRILLDKMEAGARIVLCLWIMDMDLLDKIQDHSYIQ
jgi:hypothetical protein